MKSTSKIGYTSVWDPLVRLFHWSLVIGFAAAYLTQEKEYELHVLSGYLVLGLVCFRLVWGVIGPQRARFSDFIFSPVSTLRYMELMLTGKTPRHLGHNPAGGLMTIAMLVTLLALAFSGVALDAAENRAGPLADTKLFLYANSVAKLHEFLTNTMLLLILLHLIGVFVSSRIHRENLVLAMITGKKRIPIDEHEE